MKLTTFADGWAPRRPLQRGRDRTIGDNTKMTFERVAWTVTVLVAALTAFLLLLAGYKGYAGVSAAVGAAAAINLF